MRYIQNRKKVINYRSSKSESITANALIFLLYILKCQNIEKFIKNIIFKTSYTHNFEEISTYSKISIQCSFVFPFCYDIYV